VNCSGSLSLDLPPGVAVAGGRRTLTSEVDYTVQAGADGNGNVVTLRNADAIITPLSTLTRAAEPVQQPGPIEENDLSAQPPGAAPPTAPASPTPTQPAAARPSFDCQNPRNRGEAAVCSDAGLAALDRNAAAQFARAYAVASPEQQALLRRTADRFVGYRDRCPDNRCIGDAYVGRMREIRDIMENRWQAPRYCVDKCC
jgi:uncharacterized protein YecT (DUF1311 family)